MTKTHIEDQSDQSRSSRRPRQRPESGIRLSSYSIFSLNLGLQNPEARLVLVKGGDGFKEWAKEVIRPSVSGAELYGQDLYVVDMSDVNHYAALRKTDFIVAG